VEKGRGGGCQERNRDRKDGGVFLFLCGEIDFSLKDATCSLKEEK
jgi:hypothetical protein